MVDMPGPKQPFLLVQLQTFPCASFQLPYLSLQVDFFRLFFVRKEMISWAVFCYKGRSAKDSFALTICLNNFYLLYQFQTQRSTKTCHLSPTQIQQLLILLLCFLYCFLSMVRLNLSVAFLWCSFPGFLTETLWYFQSHLLWSSESTCCLPRIVRLHSDPCCLASSWPA